MMAAEKKTYTQVKYLDREREALEKSDYFESERYPMANVNKFAFYCDIPTLRDYLTVDAKRTKGKSGTNRPRASGG